MSGRSDGSWEMSGMHGNIGRLLKSVVYCSKTLRTLLKSIENLPKTLEETLKNIGTPSKHPEYS
jgi:hypothetical protein